MSTFKIKEKAVYLFSLFIGIVFVACEKAPTEPENVGPIINYVAASPANIKPNEETTLSCIATDKEGNLLSYTWSSSTGSFPESNVGSSVKWKAPSKEGLYKILVTVNDNKLTTKDDLSVNVSNGVDTFICGLSEVSYGGESYSTVQIGNQCWLKSNLNIGIKIDSNIAPSDNGIIEKYSNPITDTLWGRQEGLYRRDEAMQYSTSPGARGICPIGWHIPTLSEYNELFASVNYDPIALTAGGRCQRENENSSGFFALFTGQRWPEGTYQNSPPGLAALMTSTSIDGDTAYRVLLLACGNEIYTGPIEKDYAISVRCIKDR